MTPRPWRGGRKGGGEPGARGNGLLVLAFAAALIPALAVCPPAGAEEGAGPAVPLSLGEAVESALATHPSVREARSGTQAAAAAVAGAEAELRPRSDLGASAVYFEEPMPVTPIHGLDVSDFPNVGGFPDFSEDLLQGELSVRYDLYAGGARRRGLERAEAQRDVATHRLVSVRQSLVAATVASYTRVLSLRSVLDAQERRIAALEAEQGRVEQLFAVGRAAEVERRRVAAALAAAGAERVHLATGLDVAERELARLTGLDAERTRAAALVPLSTSLDPPPPRDELAERTLAASPRLDAAAAELAAAELAVELAAAGRRPRVSTRGAFQEYGTFDGLDAGEWQVGLSLSLPLFDGGRVAAKVSRARAERDAARSRLESVRREVLDELDRALAAAERARARAASLAEAVESYREVARVEALRLEHGTGTQADYLDAEAELLAAESALAEARFAGLVAGSELARVTGSLEPRWIDEHLTRRGGAAEPAQEER